MAKNKESIIFVSFLVLHLLFLITFKFTAWPEMMAWPYLVTKGLLPYADIAMAHTPLLVIDLAIFYKLFGVGILQLQIYTWILILTIDVLVFWIAKRIWGGKIAIYSLIAYIFLQVFYEGNGLWFDIGVALFSLLSFYSINQKKYLLTGVFWALAFFTKQTAVWFLIPILFSLYIDSKNKLISFKNFIIGTFIIFSLCLSVFWILGILPEFFNWAVGFGIFTLPGSKGQIQLPDPKSLLVSLFPFSIFVFAIIQNFFSNHVYKVKLNQIIYFALWSIAGFLGTYPRFEYFHFQPALPYVSFFLAIILFNLKNFNKFFQFSLKVYLLILAILFLTYFMRNYKEGVRFYDTGVQSVVGEINSLANNDDTILILNYWDSVYAHTETIPASLPMVPHLEWYLSVPGVQENIVEDLSKTKPKVIVINPYTENGLSSYKPEKVYRYIIDNYNFSHKVSGVDFWYIK